jgi:hypothetical protein
MAMRTNRRKFLRNAAGLLVPISFPSIVRAGGITPAFLSSINVPAAGGDGPNLWYYGVATAEATHTETTYAAAINVGAADCCGDDIICTTGGSLTQISIKQEAALGSTAWKIGIFKLVVATWTLHEQIVTAADVVAGWNDKTLVTPLTVTNGQTVRVMAIGNGGLSWRYAGTTNGMYYSSVYATEFVSTPTFETNDYQFGVGAYVD